MNKVMMIVAAGLLTATLAYAEGENKDTTDVSKNPITGTKKTTKKHKKSMKDAAGTEHEESSKQVTKEYKDGGVKQTTETKTETDPAKH
jgi:hypothetical protein